MAYYLQIFGTSTDCLTRSEVAEFIREGAYLSEEAVFDPPANDSESRLIEWERLAVHDGGRSLQIERHVGDQRLREEVAKLLFVLPKTTPSPERDWVIDTLRRAEQLITLCIEAPAATDDEWEMLDNLEALLLERCNGILFAPREGFYDAKLELKHRI